MVLTFESTVPGTGEDVLSAHASELLSRHRVGASRLARRLGVTGRSRKSGSPADRGGQLPGYGIVLAELSGDLLDDDG